MEPTIFRRTMEHVIAGVTTSAPINMVIVFTISNLTANPITLTLLTTFLATIVSGLRTYMVLSSQDKRTNI